MRWTAGLLCGMLWMGVNFALIKKIIEIALLKQNDRRLRAILMIKFPVLYLGGFALLNLRIFPIESILAGSAIPLIIIGIYKLCPRLTQACRNSRTS
jgi:hypothetical protein